MIDSKLAQLVEQAATEKRLLERASAIHSNGNASSEDHQPATRTASYAMPDEKTSNWLY